MNSITSSMKRRITLINEISKAAGWSRAVTAVHVARVKKTYGISAERFLDEKLYEVAFEDLAKFKKKPNENISFVAQKREISYEQAELLMKKVRNEHGVGFAEFVRQGLWKAKTDKGLENRLKRIRSRNLTFIRQVSYETGWSEEEAEQRMLTAIRRWPAITFRKYAAYHFHGLSDDQIAARMEQWKEAARQNRKTVRDASGWTDREVREHMTRCEVEYGLIPAYYMCYRAWELSEEELQTYATQAHSQKLSIHFNSPEELANARNKERFDELFEPFLNRKFWVNRPDAPFEEFQQFTSGVKAIFCKLQQSGGGVGAFRKDVPSSRQGQLILFQELMEKPLLLVEEELSQHPDMEKFYPRSINTIRVVVIQVEGEMKIISVSAQFGHREITDNFTNDGMVCAVDQSTGIIQTPAVDRYGTVYQQHPVSGERFVGFSIPHWDLVLETVARATNHRQGLNFVGWDVAVLEDKVSILEANTVPDPALYQAAFAPQKKGVRFLYDPYLEMVRS